MNARSKKVRPRSGGKRIADHKAKGKKTARGKTTTKLLVAMTGKASAAKAAEGDEPVFAYIASLPQPQRRIAERGRLPTGMKARGAPTTSSRESMRAQRSMASSSVQ
jgi:hypothetical protein